MHLVCLCVCVSLVIAIGSLVYCPFVDWLAEWVLSWLLLLFNLLVFSLSVFESIILIQAIVRQQSWNENRLQMQRTKYKKWRLQTSKPVIYQWFYPHDFVMRRNKRRTHSHRSIGDLAKLSMYQYLMCIVISLYASNFCCYIQFRRNRLCQSIVLVCTFSLPVFAFILFILVYVCVDVTSTKVSEKKKPSSRWKGKKLLLKLTANNVQLRTHNCPKSSIDFNRTFR